jgi:hypothetical protein
MFSISQGEFRFCENNIKNLYEFFDSFFFAIFLQFNYITNNKPQIEFIDYFQLFLHAQDGHF